MEEMNQAVREVESRLDVVSKRNIEYSTIILGVGYVGLFAAWGFTKDLIGDIAVLWSALFGLLSLSGFILFEVFSMLLNTADLLALYHATTDRTRLAQRIQQGQKWAQEIRDQYLLIWVFVLIYCLATGLLSAGILIFGFVQSLLMSV